MHSPPARAHRAGRPEGDHRGAHPDRARQERERHDVRKRAAEEVQENQEHAALLLVEDLPKDLPTDMNWYTVSHSIPTS